MLPAPPPSGTAPSPEDVARYVRHRLRPVSRWGPRAATIVPVLVLRAIWWSASGPLLTMLQLGWADGAMSWRFDGRTGRHRGSATVELANRYLAELQRVRPELEIVHPAALILPEGP